jgi:hypothetical protein
MVFLSVERCDACIVGVQQKKKQMQSRAKKA